MHGLEIPIVLQWFRLPPGSKLHPALLCHKHLQSVQKKGCKWNLKWQRVASISLPQRQQEILAEKADRNE